ncbi:MAG TPA: hypothetical protein VGB14_18035 [Acidimicrobiales bacterium]
MRRPLVAIATAVALAAAGCGDDAVTTTATAPPEQPPRYEVTTTVLESADHGPQLCLGGIADSYPPQCGGPDLAGWSWDAVAGKESAAGTTWATVHVVGTFDGERFTLTEPPGPPGDAGPPTPLPDLSPACDQPVGTAAPAEAFAGVGGVPGEVAVWVSDPAGGEWDGPFTVSVVVRPGSGPAAEARVREMWAGPLCVVERDLPSAADLAAVQEEAHAGGGPGTPLGTVYASWTEPREGVVVLSVAVADDAAMAYAAERWGDLVRLEGILTPIG